MTAYVVWDGTRQGPNAGLLLVPAETPRQPPALRPPRQQAGRVEGVVVAYLKAHRGAHHGDAVAQATGLRQDSVRTALRRAEHRGLLTSRAVALTGGGRRIYYEAIP